MRLSSIGIARLRFIWCQLISLTHFCLSSWNFSVCFYSPRNHPKLFLHGGENFPAPSPIVKALFNPLLTSLLLAFHWSKKSPDSSQHLCGREPHKCKDTERNGSLWANTVSIYTTHVCFRDRFIFRRYFQRVEICLLSRNTQIQLAQHDGLCKHSVTLECLPCSCLYPMKCSGGWKG